MAPRLFHHLSLIAVLQHALQRRRLLHIDDASGYSATGRGMPFLRLSSAGVVACRMMKVGGRKIRPPISIVCNERGSPGSF